MRLACAAVFLSVTACSAQTLWHDPGDISSLDFGGTVGAAVSMPKPPFRFVREDLSGTQPKLFARDANGLMWDVKFGYEVKPESFCWRVVHACGYFAEPSFFVASGKFEGYKPIRRATASLKPDGSFIQGRFQYRDPELKFLQRNWRWDRPPFAGTKELSGLKILIMLFSNWDNKDGRVGGGGPNTAIFEDKGKLIYAFTDWGSGMGSWGSKPGSDTNWRCEDFAKQTPGFVQGVREGRVVFGWSGAINAGFKSAIPPAHVAWLMGYLGKISDEQLHAGLKASGAMDGEAECFAKALRGRIERLRRVAGRD